MSEKIQGTARSGDKITLDTSDKACAKFGVKPGEEIIPLGCGASREFVVGTGPAIGGSSVLDGTEVLWTSRKKGETTKLGFFSSKKHFRKI
jgi:hypothetical protein